MSKRNSRTIPRVSMVRDALDKVKMAMDVKAGYRPAADQSLQESARRLFPRKEELPSLNQLFKTIQEATTASAPLLLGNSLNKAVRQYMTEDPAEQSWRAFVTTKSLTDLKAQKSIVFGGLGGLPKRTQEDGPYLDIGFPPEEQSEYSPFQRAGKIRITRHMIKNDDTGTIEQMGRQLATAANEDLKRFILSLVAGTSGGGGVNSDTVSDGLTLYHAGHGNLGTAALDLTNLKARRAAIKRQWVPGQKTAIEDSGGIDDSVTTIGLASTQGFEPGNIFRIGTELIKVGAVNHDLSQVSSCTRGLYSTTPASHADGAAAQIQARPVSFKSLHLVVPDDLEETAYELLASPQIPGSNQNNRNFLNKEHEERRIEIVSYHPTYLADNIANWFLVADKESIPSIEVGFVDGLEEAEIFYQGDPLLGDVFAFDVLTFKARHEYGGVVSDWRGMQGSVVA